MPVTGGGYIKKFTRCRETNKRMGNEISYLGETVNRCIYAEVQTGSLRLYLGKKGRGEKGFTVRGFQRTLKGS